MSYFKNYTHNHNKLYANNIINRKLQHPNNNHRILRVTSKIICASKYKFIHKFIIKIILQGLNCKTCSLNTVNKDFKQQPFSQQIRDHMIDSNMHKIDTLWFCIYSFVDRYFKSICLKLFV